jgi:hypothetical protein
LGQLIAARIETKIHESQFDQQTNALVELPLDLEEFKKAINLSIEWVKKEEFEEMMRGLQKYLESS